eukprot:11113578-Alexandrium_andersonii.AAC.1
MTVLTCASLPVFCVPALELTPSASSGSDSSSPPGSPKQPWPSAGSICLPSSASARCCRGSTDGSSARSPSCSSSLSSSTSSDSSASRCAS